MQRLLPAGLAETSRRELPDEVEAVVAAGWEVGPGGALLLTALRGDGWRSKIDRSDVGGYEYDVNDVYIPLSDLATDMDTYLPRAVSRGVSFAVRMLKSASGLPESDHLAAVVSVWVDTDDEDFLLQGATVRFLSRRGDYPEWIDDPERFSQEAVAVIEMVDAAKDFA